MHCTEVGSSHLVHVVVVASRCVAAGMRHASLCWIAMRGQSVSAGADPLQTCWGTRMRSTLLDAKSKALSPAHTMPCCAPTQAGVDGGRRRRSRLCLSKLEP